MRKIVDEFVKAYNVGNAPHIASMFTEEGVLMPPNEPPVVGKESVRWRLQVFFDAFSFDMNLAPAENYFIGELGFERGTYTAYALSQDGGAPRGGQGEYMFLFEEQFGSWKISAFGTSPSEMRQAEDWQYKWACTLSDLRQSSIPTNVVDKIIKEPPKK